LLRRRAVDGDRRETAKPKAENECHSDRAHIFFHGELSVALN
jgi:hypothetical protein